MHRVLACILLVCAICAPSVESFQLKASSNILFPASRTKLQILANERRRKFSLRMSGDANDQAATILAAKNPVVAKLLAERDQALAELAQIKNPYTSVRAILDSSLPPVEDVSSLAQNSFTVSSGSRKPVNVQGWNVREDVIKYRESLSPEILDRQIRKLPTTEMQEATAESILHVDFYDIVGRAIADITEAAGNPMKLTMLSSVEPEEGESATRETADFVLVQVEKEPKSNPVPEPSTTKVSSRTGKQQKMTARLAAKIRMLANTRRAAGECKRHNLCLDESKADLVTRYNGRKNVLTCALEQLIGYMVKCKAEYGFLTTYNWLWLTRIDENRILYVSEAFSADTTGPASVLNAMNYLTHLVSQGEADFLPPSFDVGYRKTAQVGNAANESSAEKGAGSGAVEQGTDQSDTVTNSSTTVEVVAEFPDHHQDRLCFVMRQYGKEDGELFVVKGFSEKWKRDRELNIYRRLQDLQGRGIPRVVNSSVVLYDHPDRQHGMVLEWAGRDLDAMDRPPALPVINQLREVIREMHCRGVVHGDLATRNIAWRQKTDRISVLDLGEAKTAEELGPADFADMCHDDMTAVEEVLAQIQEDAEIWAEVDGMNC